MGRCPTLTGQLQGRAAQQNTAVLTQERSGEAAHSPGTCTPAPIHSSSFSHPLSSFTNHEHTEDEKQALSEPRGLSEAGTGICLSEQ